MIDGIRVGVTSYRKGASLVEALRRRGADVLHGPTIGGDAPVDVAEILADTETIIASKPAWLVASTGVGMQLWVDAAAAGGREDDLRHTARDARCVARGAKAVGGLRRLGVEPVWCSTAQTDADVAGWLAQRVLPGEVVAVQLHGGLVDAAFAPVIDASAEVVSVATYRHRLPDELSPAHDLVEAIVAGDLDLVTFTSPGAARNLITIAEQMGEHRDAAIISAFRDRVATASVGPVTASALEQLGIPVWITPTRWHTGDLIRSIESWAQRRHQVPHAPPNVRLVPDECTMIDVDGRPVDLGHRGYAVLAALARRPGVVVPPAQLLAEAWGHAAPSNESAVKHQVARLRRKLEGSGVDIRTVRGVGYRLEGTSRS